MVQIKLGKIYEAFSGFVWVDDIKKELREGFLLNDPIVYFRYIKHPDEKHSCVMANTRHWRQLKEEWYEQLDYQRGKSI